MRINKEKRKGFIKTKTINRFKLVNIIMLVVVVSLFLNTYDSMKMIEEGRIIFGGEVPYIEYQLNYAGIILALIVTLLFVMHYSLGPVGRMENILDEVIKGNYSLRITLREKDALRPFVDRLNKVLSLLENKSHSLKRVKEGYI